MAGVPGVAGPATQEFSIVDRALYGLGQLAEGVKNIALAVFVLFYYNNLLGLDPMLSGAAMLIALVVDSVTDPLIGALSDRWQSRWGRRHPFMYIAILPLTVLFYLLFAPPAGLGQWGLFAWLTGVSILARLALTFFIVPHMAMGAELSREYGERTRLVGWRQGMNSFGAMATYLLAFMVFFPVTQRDAGAYPGFALALSLLMGGSMLVSALGTHHLIPRLIQPVKQARLSTWAIIRETVQALGNRNFRWYFSGALMIYMVIGVDSALLLYLNTYVWEVSGRPLTWITAGLFFGYLLGAPFTQLLVRKFEKKPVLIWGTALIGLFQMLPVMLWLGGFLPAAGTMQLVAALSAMRIVQGMCSIHPNVVGGSMLADVADEVELKSGQRQEGVFFGAQLITYKATSGLGKFVSGIVLAVIAWPTSEQIKAAGGVVGDDKLFWLAIAYGPAMSVFALLAVACYTRYRLDKGEHDRIVSELGKRQGSPAPETASAPALPNTERAPA